MSELILSDDERDLSWAEAPDKLVADITRHLLVTAEQINQRDANVKTLLAGAAIISLLRLVNDCNAGSAEYRLDQVSDAAGEFGDFVITVERTNKPRQGDQL